MDPDTDGDGLDDYNEVMVYGTNPAIDNIMFDSDGDQILDLLEYALGTDLANGDDPEQSVIEMKVVYPALGSTLD